MSTCYNAGPVEDEVEYGLAEFGQLVVLGD